MLIRRKIWLLVSMATATCATVASVGLYGLSGVNASVEQITHQSSPVRGGTTPDRDTDQAARLEVAEELGHSRESVTTHYLGR